MTAPWLLGNAAAYGRRRPRLVLFLAAFTVRLGFIAAYGPSAPPTAWGDDPDYDAIAYQLVAHHQYINTWFPPGYPLFLAFIYAVVGRHLVAVRIIQAALGAATCVLTYSLGSRVFSERVGSLAAVLLSIYPGHAYMSWRIMAESLYMCLLVLGVLLAVRLSENPRPIPAALLGSVVGFANLVKSNLFIFPPMLVAWLGLTAEGSQRQRTSALAWLIAIFAVVLVVTPIANSLSPGGQAAALPGNAGHSLWWSNNPVANGYFKSPDEHPAGRAFIERHGATDQLARADAFEKDRIYRRLAISWIREYPGQFLVLCLKKLNNAFGLFPHAASLEANRLARMVHLLTYGLLAPFALAGMVAALERWRQCALLYVIVSSYVLMVIIFYGTPRFTIIVIPYLLIFASYAFWGGLAFLSDREQRARAQRCSA